MFCTLEEDKHTCRCTPRYVVLGLIRLDWDKTPEMHSAVCRPTQTVPCACVYVPPEDWALLKCTGLDYEHNKRRHGLRPLSVVAPVHSYHLNV